MTKQIILIVEDSDDDAFLVDRVLRRHVGDSLQIERRKTMTEAMSFITANEKAVGLILLDLGLPDTKGADDTFARMKGYAPHIPVVILTGMNDHDLALRFMKEGAEDFVNKDMLHDKPQHLSDAVEFAICRHNLVHDKIAEKDMVISWMSGGYSASNGTSTDRH